MKKRLLPIAAALLLLAGCASPDEPAASTTVATSTTTAPSTSSSSETSSSSTTSSAPTTVESTPAQEPTPAAAKNTTPTIDQLVITANSINGHGVYLDPNNGTYYYCNTTDYMWANVAAGTCDGPYTYDGASAKFDEAGEDWYNQSVEDLGLDDSELDTNSSLYPDSPEDAVFSSCWENGYAQFTDGSVRPYADCELPPIEQEPSPWVQGQIDWANCLDAGNTEEYCRETLN